MQYKLSWKPIGKVLFQPWVGENYWQRYPRLLVVGMSHYSWDKEIDDYLVTNAVILDQINGDARGKFFTKIVATCIGHLPTGSEREQFWRSVAFYNYIQKFVGDSPRQKHEYQLWKNAEPAFAEVLNALRPRLLMFIGHANWGNSAHLNGWKGPDLSRAPEPKYADTWRYPLKDRTSALGFHVKHTSAGYNFGKFAAPFIEAEKLARIAAERAQGVS